MAVQIEARGQVQDFLDVLRRRALLVLVPAIFGLVIGACLAAIVPRKFLAKTQLELRQVGPTPLGREGQNAKFQVMAPARIKKVVEELKSPMYLALSEPDRRDFLGTIGRNVGVNWNAPGSQSSIFITITYTHVDRIWAGTFLKALRDDWKEDVLELDRNKLRDEKLRLGIERDKLEKQLHKEEEELGNLKRQNGISATQPIPGSMGQRTEDPDYDRLQRARTQLTATKLALGNAKAKMAILESRYAELPEKIFDERVVEGESHEAEVRSLESSIIDLNEKLRGYGKMHRKYRLLSAQIEALERKKAELEGLVTRHQLTSVESPNPERGKVRQELEGLKTEIASLETTQRFLEGAIEEATRSVADLHDVYREVREREGKINRLNLDLIDADRDYQNKVRLVVLTEDPKSNPFAILEEISVPQRPTEPNPFMLVAFAVAAGLSIGVGLAVLLEYSKSCFRSVYDISRVMVVPVLGNINTIVTAREARLRLGRRLLVGTASFLFLGSLAFVTWAWSKESELLSTEVRNAIEGLRSALK